MKTKRTIKCHNKSASDMYNIVHMILTKHKRKRNDKIFGINLFRMPFLTISRHTPSLRYERRRNIILMKH